MTTQQSYPGTSSLDAMQDTSTICPVPSIKAMGFFLKDPTIPDLHENYSFNLNLDYLRGSGSSRIMIEDTAVLTGQQVYTNLDFAKAPNLSFEHFEEQGLIDNAQFHQVNVFAVLNAALDLVEEEIGHRLNWLDGGAINPGHWKLWQFLNHVSDDQLKQMSIDNCADFEGLPPYNLDYPCIRRSHDGMWNFMNRIRKIWGETAQIYPSLTDLLQKESVSITGLYRYRWRILCYQDRCKLDRQYLDRPVSSIPHSNSLDRADHPFDRDLAIAAHDRISDQWISVESSHIDRIAFDAPAQVLFVHFRSAAIYAYFNVIISLWHGFFPLTPKGAFSMPGFAIKFLISVFEHSRFTVVTQHVIPFSRKGETNGVISMVWLRGK